MQTQNGNQTAPALNPPDVSGMAEVPLPLASMMTAERAAARLEAPNLTPPSQRAVQGSADAVAAWHNAKKITALWTNDAALSAWIAIDGLGWKRLSTAQESAHVTMALLAAHAEQTGATVNVRIEADDMVHEIYVW